MKKPMHALLCDQRQKVPPVVKVDLTGKTVIVIGANVGLGFEATKHLATMKPARLILACRSEAKGREAIKELEAETGYQGTELRTVDLASFKSVQALAAGVEQDGLAIDIMVYNAGVLMAEHQTTDDGWEQTFVLFSLPSTILLIPAAQRAAAARPGSSPRLVIVGSDVHYWAEMPDKVINAPSGKVLHELNKPENWLKAATQQPRYNQSKVLILLLIRELSKHLERTPLIAVIVNPGYCVSALRRNLPSGAQRAARLMEIAVGRSTEEGSRMLVWSAVGNEDHRDELRGAYINLCKIDEPSDFAISKVGQEVQKRLWAESVEVLSAVSPAFKGIVSQL
ncbi:short-chain dehydrogenase [Peniophora sp. CONT]|nr:short-chain dehydrogenase [Peniophora sp. CONT]